MTNSLPKSFNILSHRLRLPALVLVAALANLTGCTTVDKYSVSTVDASGKPVEVAVSCSTSSQNQSINSTTCEPTTGTVLSEALAPGAKIDVKGRMSSTNDLIEVIRLGLIVTACVGGTCGTDAPTAANCPGYNYVLQYCSELAKDNSYTVQCPNQCPPKEAPRLVMASYKSMTYESQGIACKCALPPPPACSDLDALRKSGSDVCTPVELPLMQQNRPNDLLLKQMMSPRSPAGCQRVYSMALHQYVCQ